MVAVTTVDGREHGPAGVAGSQRRLQGSAADRRQEPRSQLTKNITALLTIEGAAERLGVTPRMVRRLVYERRIGFVYIGKFIRLRQEDLDTYLEEHFQPPLDRRPGGR